MNKKLYFKFECQIFFIDLCICLLYEYCIYLLQFKLFVINFTFRKFNGNLMFSMHIIT